MQAHVCEVGREKDEGHTNKWVLPYPDPCLCKQQIMGGMNNWKPIRPIKSTDVYTRLLPEDVNKMGTRDKLSCEENGRHILFKYHVVRHYVHNFT